MYILEVVRNIGSVVRLSSEYATVWRAKFFKVGDAYF